MRVADVRYLITRINTYFPQTFCDLPLLVRCGIFAGYQVTRSTNNFSARRCEGRKDYG